MVLIGEISESMEEGVKWLWRAAAGLECEGRRVESATRSITIFSGRRHLYVLGGRECLKCECVCLLVMSMRSVSVLVW